MKKRILYLSLICLALLMGCSKEETFEDFFHKTMKGTNTQVENVPYTLIYKEMNIVHENDAIAIFTQDYEGKKTIYIAYFEKENNNWYWRRTRGAIWNSTVEWASMNQVPYIYSGAIDDKLISGIYAGEAPAKIIQVEGNKRFWYAISDKKKVPVRMVKTDGTRERIEQIEGRWNKVVEY